MEAIDGRYTEQQHPAGDLLRSGLGHFDQLTVTTPRPVYCHNSDVKRVLKLNPGRALTALSGYHHHWLSNDHQPSGDQTATAVFGCCEKRERANEACTQQSCGLGSVNRAAEEIDLRGFAASRTHEARLLRIF